MSNNAPDYHDNLVFPPQEVKSQDDIKQEGRQSEVLIKALEKCEKLEKQLKIAVDMLKRINMYSLASNDDVDDQVADIFNWSGDAITQIEDLDK